MQLLVAPPDYWGWLQVVRDCHVFSGMHGIFGYNDVCLADGVPFLREPACAIQIRDYRRPEATGI